MPITKYTKWTGSPLDGLSLEELLDEMSEFFIQSGFSQGYSGLADPRDLEALRRAIVEKLFEMGRISEQMLEQWLDQTGSEDASKLDELVSELIRRLIEQGYIRTEREFS